MDDRLFQLLGEAADAGFEDFAKWCATSWLMTEKDRLASSPVESEEFARGWNAAVNSIQSAYDCYREER